MMTLKEIDSLNKHFGAKARIAFRLDSCGFPIASLAGKYGAAELSLYGAQVMTYRPIGHGPVLFLSPRAIYEEGKAIRGGIPLCWPWFGRREGLPSHGFARTMLWKVLSSAYCDETIELVLGIVDTPETKKIFPYSFGAQLRITVGQSLKLELVTRNAGIAPMPLAPAFHPYFRTLRAHEVRVRELDGAPFKDMTNGTEGIQHGDVIAEAAGIDRIFKPARGHVVIDDPALNRTIDLVFEGAREITVWNPGAEKAAGFADLAAGDEGKFICVEPVHSADDLVMLKPGQRHQLTLTIQAQLK